MQSLGEALRGGKPGTIVLKSNGKSFAAAVWRHDPERRDAVEGVQMLKERIVFTIRKDLMKEAILQDDVVIWKEMKRAYIVDLTSQESADHVAWRFEARRAPGSDPE